MESTHPVADAESGPGRNPAWFRQRSTRSRKSTIGRWLPVGTALTSESYRRRCAAVMRGLALFGVVVTGVGVANESITHVLVGILPVALAIVVAITSKDRLVMTGSLTLGLAFSAAALVHFTGGLIEAHFAFFVALPLIALLHDWRAIAGATVVVFFHHAIAGTLDSTSVYNHEGAQENPIVWGLIHVLFVFALVVVLLIHWHYSEAELRVRAGGRSMISPWPKRPS